MDKFIVTGGAGFIGSHLVHQLLDYGHKVIVLDDFSTGFEWYLPLEHPDLTILKVDISDWNSLSKYFTYFKHVEGVFHLAAKARIQPSINAPHETHDSNVTGTLNILEMMRMNDITKIVYSASSSCYGKKVGRASDEKNEIDLQTPYAASKYMGELYCETWTKLHKMNCARLRYFNVWGPRSPIIGPYAPVISKFFQQAINRKPITVVGDGQQRRDFTYVSDVVDANIKAMTYLPWYSNGVNKIFNIGTGLNYSVLAIAKKIQALYPNSAIEHISERVGEAKTSLADNSLAQKELNWEPKVMLDEGLNTLKGFYYFENLQSK